MMTVDKVACPNCARSLSLSQPSRVGKRLRCPQCGCPFTLTAHDLGSVAAPPLPTVPHSPTRNPRTPPPAIPGAEVAAPSNRGLMLGGILTGLVLLVGGAIALAVHFANRDGSDGSRAANDGKTGADEKPGNSGSDPASGLLGERSRRPTEETVRPSDDKTPPGDTEEPRHDLNRPTAAEPPTFRTSLSAEDQARVNKAIDRGVEFLKSNQRLDGSWAQAHALGMAALPALTLLECGVPPDDRVIQKAAVHVRAHAPRDNWTYDIALAILFLDRLGDKKDEPLIRSLGLRLVAGQMTSGGWTYHCTVLEPRVEANFLTVLEQTRPVNPLELFVTGGDGKADLGMIGVDQRVNVAPGLIDATTRLDADGPFRGIVDGVSKLRSDDKRPNSPAPPRGVTLTETERKEKTEAARVALSNLPPPLRRSPVPPAAVDERTSAGRQLRQLEHPIRHPRRVGGDAARRADRPRHGPHRPALPHQPGGQRHLQLPLRSRRRRGRQPGDDDRGRPARPRRHPRPDGGDETGRHGGQGPARQGHSAGDGDLGRPLAADTSAGAPINLYFLWTVERVGMLYGLPKINDKDWYHWGAELLLDRQGQNGAWTVSNYPGATPLTDTSFGLLFLKRANFAKDLTVKIQSKLDLIVEDKP